MRSYEVSRSSKNWPGVRFRAIAFSTRVSMLWVSSPRPITPAMRALPLSVWSARCSARAGSKFAGAARQVRSNSPICGTSSLASSRNTGSSCWSISSSSRRWRRSSGWSAARSADSPSGWAAAGWAPSSSAIASSEALSAASTIAGSSASGAASRAASPVIAFKRAIRAVAEPGAACSRTPSYIILRACTPSLARASSCGVIETARLCSLSNAPSNAAPRSCIALSCTVPQMPARV